MWLLPLLAVLLWTLTSCAAYTHSPPLDPTQLGTAVDCDWDTGTPQHCLLDKTRATIDLDYLNKLFERLQRCQTDDFNRRKL